MKVSTCCQAPCIIGFVEDGERCSACKEHCGEEKCDHAESMAGPDGIYCPTCEVKW